MSENPEDERVTEPEETDASDSPGLHKRPAWISISAGVVVAAILAATIFGYAGDLWGPSRLYYGGNSSNFESLYPGDTERVRDTWSLSRHRQFAQALTDSQAIVADPKASKEERYTAEVDVSYDAWAVGLTSVSLNALDDFQKHGQGLRIDPRIIEESKSMARCLKQDPSGQDYNPISGQDWAGASLILSNPSFTANLTGWQMGRYSSERKLYTIGVDPNGYLPDKPSGYLESNSADTGDWNTLMQDIAADSYRGKRVRFATSFKTDNVSQNAYLWLRVDTPTVNYFAIAPKPALSGTTAWQQQAIVLDVPQDAQGIALGEVLVGSGKVSLADVHLDVVGSDVPVTPSETKF